MMLEHVGTLAIQDWAFSGHHVGWCSQLRWRSGDLSFKQAFQQFGFENAEGCHRQKECKEAAGLAQNWIQQITGPCIRLTAEAPQFSKKTGIAQSSPKLAGFQVRNTALCLRSLSNFHVLRKRPQAFVETSWKSHAFRKAATSVGPSALCEQCPFPQPSNSPNLQQEWRGTRIQTVEWDGPINHEILSDLIPILWYLLWFSSNKTGDTGCTFYLAQASTGLHSLALQQVADIMTGWSACQTLRRACRTGHCFVSSGLGTQRKSPNKKQILHTEWLYIYIKAPDFAVACCKALRRPSSCWYCSYRTTAMVRKHHQRLKFELVLGAVTERF